MLVKVTHNHLGRLVPELRKFAFSQDSEGNVDLTPGKEYVVYGIRNNKYGRFYLVLTDKRNTELPWWIPAGFFEITNDKVPKSWRIDTWEGYGQETVQADPAYFDAQEDIEDGTDKGRIVFETMKKGAED